MKRFFPDCRRNSSVKFHACLKRNAAMKRSPAPILSREMSKSIVIYAITLPSYILTTFLNASTCSKAPVKLNFLIRSSALKKKISV